MPHTQHATEPLKKIRTSKVRTLLLRHLEESKKPMSGDEILAKIRISVPSCNKTSVYRELSYLEKAGSIIAVRFHDRKIRYELSSLPHHHHAVCISCGSIEDVRMPAHVQAVEKRLQKESRFKVTHHALEFFGLCLHCQ